MLGTNTRREESTKRLVSQVVLALSDFVPTKTAEEEGGGAPLVSWAALVVLWLLPPGDEAAFADTGLVFTDFEWLPAAQRTASL